MYIYIILYIYIYIYILIYYIHILIILIISPVTPTCTYDGPGTGIQKCAWNGQQINNLTNRRHESALLTKRGESSQNSGWGRRSSEKLIYSDFRGHLDPWFLMIQVRVGVDGLVIIVVGVLLLRGVGWHQEAVGDPKAPALCMSQTETDY